MIALDSQLRERTLIPVHEVYRGWGAGGGNDRSRGGTQGEKSGGPEGGKMTRDRQGSHGKKSESD